MKVFEHGGNVYCADVNADDLLDYSANINPLGLSAKIKKSIEENIESLVHYPDPSGGKLKQAISVHYGVGVSSIILGNGAVELLYVYLHTFRPKRVLIPVPSFSEYERAAIAGECEIDYFFLKEADNFSLSVLELEKYIPKYDLVFLGNPNNPTGELLNKDIIYRFLSLGKTSGTQFIVDESFIDFREDAELYTARTLVKEFPNLFIIQSLTKFYAIPGLRLGFGLATNSVIEKMEAGKDPWNVNLLAQAAGAAGLTDEEYQKKTRAAVKKESLELSNWLGEIEGVKVYPSSVNYIFLNISGTGISSDIFTSTMRKRNILVRDCSNYPGLDERYIRVAVRNHNENKRLIEVFRSVVEELGGGKND